MNDGLLGVRAVSICSVVEGATRQSFLVSFKLKTLR
jgi:hypothetical protein